MTSVLVVEDDPTIRASLIDVLTSHQLLVRSSPDGFGALREITRWQPDAVVLDLGLPDIDGADALRMIRGLSQVPVLVATARDDDAEIIKLLNAGADDYLVKPFSGGQLVARLTAVLRRCAAPGGLLDAGDPTAPGDRSGTTQGPLVVGELRIDALARTVHLAGREVGLTRREFDLLAFLARNAGRVVSRRKILAEVWRQPYVDEQTVDVHLSCLRRKLGERASRPRYLHTVRGVGVKLVSPL
ncbi:response regulator transcription factor [Kitasatospora sp. NBC_01250]|uniref:response regulator transcription factor n=1 Tax=unclassified Kitasatospora TaxID=2633591 RepID=UPI002E0F9D5C|nr:MULTISPECIES: response regulator transcription factor [unclassified Kitasatospora]WSJ65233.1 response regulator transcription factor [Kitasatospora sp. NBC_01302]